MGSQVVGHGSGKRAQYEFHRSIACLDADGSVEEDDRYYDAMAMIRWVGLKPPTQCSASDANLAYIRRYPRMQGRPGGVRP